MRGIALTYETVREWGLKFGQTYANGLRHKSPRPGDIWHLDEVFLKIRGVGHLGPTLQRQESCQEVLPQAVKEIAICPACGHYRQAEELQCRDCRNATAK
jgi:hypothetical protein